MCGVYACINSIALLAPQIDLDGLFPYLMRKLDRRLCAVIVHGLSNKELRKWVFAACIAYCAKQHIRLRYQQCRKRPIDEHWQMMQTHYRLHGAGSIVLGIAGTHEHWTCVEKITERTLLLADSGTLRRLYRRHIAIAGSAVHKLNPRDTFLMVIDRK